MVGVLIMAQSATLRDILSPLENKSPDEIARLFASEGVRGLHFQACRCPVARYIAKKTDHDPYAMAVGIDRIELWDTVEGFVDNVEVFRLTQDSPIYNFIVKFDNGGYPELEDKWETPERMTS